MRKTSSCKLISVLLAFVLTFGALPLSNAATVTPEDALEGVALANNFSITKEVVRDGDKAIQYSGAEEGTTSLGVVCVEPDTNYLLSGWLRRGADGDVARVTVSGDGLNQKIESVDAGEWNYYSVQFNSGSNTTLKVAVVGKGTAYFDAVSLKSIARPADSRITNGDFESGDVGWSMSNAEIQSERTHNGSSKALKWNGRFLLLANTVANVEPDTWYVLSGYIYRTANDSWAYIDMNDAEGEVQLRATNPDKINDWEHVSGLWYSGENTSTGIRIVIENNWDDPKDGSSNTGNSTVYFDDISLVKAEVGKELIKDTGFTRRGWELSGSMSYANDIYYQAAPSVASGKYVTAQNPGIALANQGELIELKKDTDYFLSGWFFRTGGVGDSAKGGKTVSGELQILDENDNVLASFTGTRYNQKDWHYNPAAIVKNGEWEYVAGLWNSGGITQVKVRLVAKAEAEEVKDKVYFDDVSFRQADLTLVSDRLLSYNVNLFQDNAASKLMDGNFDFQFNAASGFEGVVLDPEGEMADSLSYELYQWIDSHKRTLQSTPLERKTVPVDAQNGTIRLSFANAYEPGQYLLVVKYNGKIIQYESELGALYTDSVQVENAVPRMQIIFNDENDKPLTKPTVKTGYDYRPNYNAPTESEKRMSSDEYYGYLKNLSTFPTTMTIDGKPLRGFGEDSFTVLSQKEVEQEDNHSLHTTTVLSYKQFADLHFTIESYYYPDYAAFDWTIYYENVSERDNTPVITDIRSTDMTMVGGNQYILTNKGDAERYTAEEHTMVGMKQVYAPTTGRSTQGAYPYYNFEYGSGGSLIAIGWNGQWEATFDCTQRGMTHFVAGQQLFNAYLKPGEKMRTPLIAFVRYEGRDTDRATNLWRRWLTDCNLRKVTEDASGEGGKKLFDPQVSGGTSVLYHEMTQATDDNQIAAIKWYDENGIDISFWWMDAGWYFQSSNEGVNAGKGESLGDGVWANTGVWQVDTKRFPSKMKAISDYGETVGVHTLLWFEPERIGDFGCCLEDGTTVNRNWVLSGSLVDLGNREALEWFKERITKIIGEGGIYMYREDFNIAPLGIWRGADAKNRQGVTENKYIQGHMELWDYILEKYPYVTIDSCASGGNRNDLETYRRGVALHKTDLDYGNQTMQQGIEYAYNQWNVYYGSKANGDGDSGTYYASKYALRSAVCPWMVLGYSTHRGIPSPDGVGYIAGDEVPLDTNIIRDVVDEQWATGEYIYADYYGLTPLDQTEENWIGWEYYDEQKDSGYAIAYRRGAGQAQQTLKLKGLDPNKKYTVFFEDRNDYATYTGAELMYKGILWTLPADKTSDILWISAASNGIRQRALSVNVTGPSVNKLTQNWTTGELRAAIYPTGDYYEFAIRMNMALRNTFFGMGEGRYEDVSVEEYGDVIRVNDKTLSQIEKEAPGSVKLVYDVDLHNLNVYIAKNNTIGFAPEQDCSVQIDKLTTQQKVSTARPVVYRYTAENKSWEKESEGDLYVTLGDINNDGNIDAADALLALQHSVRLTTLDETQFLAANVDNNDRVDASDALLILQCSVSLIDPEDFPAAKK